MAKLEGPRGYLMPLRDESLRLQKSFKAVLGVSEGGGGGYAWIMKQDCKRKKKAVKGAGGVVLVCLLHAGKGNPGGVQLPPTKKIALKIKRGRPRDDTGRSEGEAKRIQVADYDVKKKKKKKKRPREAEEGRGVPSA